LREHLLSRKCFTANEELAHKEINCVHTAELRNIEIYLHEITCIRTAELRFYSRIWEGKSRPTVIRRNVYYKKIASLMIHVSQLWFTRTQFVRRSQPLCRDRNERNISFKLASHNTHTVRRTSKNVLLPCSVQWT
jgi:hypothetical protein